MPAAAPVPAPMPPLSSVPGMPGMPPMPPLSGTYYPQPGTAPLQAPPFPPNNPYGAIPPPTGAQSNQTAPMGGLPPNVLALLQSVQRQTPPTSQYGMPQVMNSPPPGPAGGNPQYQQLMSYLVNIPLL